MHTSHRTQLFTESVIREMTRVAREHDAINLAQGFPDFPAPDLLKEAAASAIHARMLMAWRRPSAMGSRRSPSAVRVHVRRFRGGVAVVDALLGPLTGLLVRQLHR